MRTFARWLHLLLAIPILGYVYSPFENLPSYAFPTRYIFMPALIVMGLWMWQGQRVLRLFGRGRAPTMANKQHSH